METTYDCYMYVHNTQSQYHDGGVDSKQHVATVRIILWRILCVCECVALIRNMNTKSEREEKAVM